MVSHVIIHRCIKDGIPSLDAFCASWITYKALETRGVKPKLVGLTYGQALPEFLFKECPDSLNLYVLDLNISSKDLYTLKDNKSRVTIIDHHNTSQMLVNEEGIGKDGNWLKPVICHTCSTASLTWNYWFPKRDLPPFIQYINDYTLDKKELYNCDAVIASYNVLGVTFSTFSRYYFLGKDFVELAVTYGKKALEKSISKAEALVKEAEVGEVAGYSKIPFVTLYGIDYKHSDLVGKKLQKQYPEAKFTAVLNDGYAWKLYSSSEETDSIVTTIAEEYGGGSYLNKGEYRLFTYCRLPKEAQTERIIKYIY